MARKTYKTKTAAKRAAKGSEIYHAKGPPAGWRISRGRKVRGKRGLAQRKRKLLKRIKKEKKKRVRRSKRRKKVSWIKIKIGNPNPEVCGFG